MMKPSPPSAQGKPAANGNSSGSSIIRKLPPAPALKKDAAAIAQAAQSANAQNKSEATSKEATSPRPQLTNSGTLGGGRTLPTRPPGGSISAGTGTAISASPTNGSNISSSPNGTTPPPVSPREGVTPTSPRPLPAAKPPATQAASTPPSEGTGLPRSGSGSISKVNPTPPPRKITATSAINIPTSNGASAQSATSPTASSTPVSPRSQVPLSPRNALTSSATPPTSSSVASSPATSAASSPATSVASSPATSTPASPTAVTTPARVPTSPRNTFSNNTPAPTPAPRSLSPTPIITPTAKPKEEPPKPKEEPPKPKEEPPKPKEEPPKQDTPVDKPKPEIVTPFVPTKPAAAVQKGFTATHPTADSSATSPIRASNARLDFAAHRISQTDPANTQGTASPTPTPVVTPIVTPVVTPVVAPVAQRPAQPEPVAQEAPPAIPARSKPVPNKRAMSPPPADPDLANSGIRPNSELRKEESTHNNNTFGRKINIPEPSLPYSFSSSPPSSPSRYGSSPAWDGSGWIKTSSDNAETFASKIAKTKSFSRTTTALYDPEIMNQAKDQLKDAVRAGLNHIALELLKGYSGLMRRATMQKTSHVQCRLSEDSRCLEFSVLEKPQTLDFEKLKIQEIGRDTLLLSAIESVEPALEAKETSVAAIMSRDKDIDPTCCIAMYLRGKPVGPESPVILVASTRQEFATYYDGLRLVTRGNREGLQVETEIDIVSEVLAISEIYSATVDALPLSPPPVEA